MIKYLFKNCVENMSCIFKSAILAHQISECTSDCIQIIKEVSKITDEIRMIIVDNIKDNNILEKVESLELLIKELKEKIKYE
jgi:hypothetical protein